MRCATSSPSAGPETQDVDFTWEEFVRRTNFELANEWGNLVNRSISMAHKNFGAVPRPAVAPIQWTSSCSPSPSARSRPSGNCWAAAGSALPPARRCGSWVWPTSTCPRPQPWKLGDDPERQGTVLHAALQVVDDAKTLLTPFLPHSSQQVFELLGGSGVWAAQPEIREVTDFDDEVEGVGVPAVRDYPVITGDYAAQQAVWRRSRMSPGRPLVKPVAAVRASSIRPRRDRPELGTADRPDRAATTDSRCRLAPGRRPSDAPWCPRRSRCRLR